MCRAAPAARLIGPFAPPCPQAEYAVRVQLLEVYNEQLRDLLA